MSSRYIGGIVTKNPTALNPALGSAANGIFTMDQYVQQKAAGLWPANDPYNKYVTLNLHGNGTNGGQNNTFLDSSTNAFSITRNGNTTQGTFTPYGSLWSNYFTASDYLQFTGPATGTGTWTMEGWFYFTSLADAKTLFSQGTADTTSCWLIWTDANGTIRFYSNSDLAISSAGAVVANTWQHIAVVSNSSALTIYVNGVSKATGSYSSKVFTGAPFQVNRGYGGATSGNACYISNARMVVGTAVYTAAFTPPTAPLTAVSGTSLLTCQSNRFIDNSTNNYTATLGGSPSVQRFSPFAPSAAYSTATIGGSGYFDGSGDYLSVANNTAFDISGSTSWCVECWAYWNSVTGEQNIVEKFTGPTGPGWTLYKFAPASNGGVIDFYGGSTSFSSTITPVAGQWYHIAICRDNATSRTSFFINGTRTATTTSFTVANNAATALLVGVRGGGTTYMNGLLDDVRVVKGSSVYDPGSTTITVPTAPLTAITNTSLLLNMTNGAIYDNAMMNDLETVGNAQISTSVKKYGTGSLYFDGNGDWLTLPSLAILNQTGDFTHECWVYLTAYPSSMATTIYGFETANFLKLGISTTGQLLCDKSGVGVQITGSIMSLNTWYHVALVRSGSGTNNVTLYLNGTSAGQATGTNSVTVSGLGYIARRTDANNVSITGYIDDLRITNGYARYTAAFTPPTSQLQDQ